MPSCPFPSFSLKCTCEGWLSIYELEYENEGHPLGIVEQIVRQNLGLWQLQDTALFILDYIHIYTVYSIKYTQGKENK